MLAGKRAFNAFIEVVVNKYDWTAKKFQSSGTILGFYMGYFADLCHESRRHAHLFLSEASERFDGQLSIQLGRAADHYTHIYEAFPSLNDLFPWSQPHAPIGDPDRRREAVELLTRIKQMESEG